MRMCWWLSLGSVAWLTGCATIYMPAPPQVALLDEEGDVHLSGYIGTGTGGTIAYAVTDKVSIRGGAHKSDMARPTFLVEGGLGFTHAIRPDEARPEFGGSFGVTVDAGRGRAWDRYQEFYLFETQDYEPETYTYDASVWSVNSRGFGAFEAKHIVVGATLGVMVQQHYLLAGTDMVPRPASVTDYAFIEPTAFLRLGSKPVFFEGHVGYSLPLEELPEDVTNFPMVIGLGLVLELGRTPIEEW